MRNCFQYPLEGHSQTSNDQALLNPFYHCIKMKAYMRVEGGVTLYPGVDCPPPLPPPTLPQVNIDYVRRDEIMRNCFQYPLEELSETSNNRALLIPFIIT